MPKKSLQQVLSQIEKLQKEAAAMRQREISGVVERIQEAIRHYGLTPADLFDGIDSKKQPRGRAAVQKRGGAPKYQCEDGRTWSGVGKRPAWFVAALEAGKSPEDLLVKGMASTASESRGTSKRRSRPAKTAGVPKFHDGTGKTWTGRGKRPTWFVEALASGKTADDLLIR